MAYTPFTWQVGLAGGTKITAVRLNNIETGIDSAWAELEGRLSAGTLTTTINTAVSSAITALPANSLTVAQVNGLRGELDFKVDRDEEITSTQMLDPISSVVGLITGRRIIEALDTLVGVQVIRYTTTWFDVPRSTAKVRLYFSQNAPTAPAPVGMGIHDLWFQSPDAP